MKTTMTGLLLSLALASLAAAAEGDDFARRGLYVGAGGLHAFQAFDVPSVTVTRFGTPVTHIDLEAGDSWGADGRVGYRFHRHFAAEGQVQYFDEFGLSSRATGSVRGHLPVGSLDGAAVTGNVKAYPLTGRIQPYALGGVGAMLLHFEDVSGSIDDVEGGFAGRLGAGLDVYVTRSLSLNGELSYLLPTGNLGDFRTLPVGAGVQYHFN